MTLVILLFAVGVIGAVVLYMSRKVNSQASQSGMPREELQQEPASRVKRANRKTRLSEEQLEVLFAARAGATILGGASSPAETPGTRVFHLRTLNALVRQGLLMARENGQFELTPKGRETFGSLQLRQLQKR